MAPPFQLASLPMDTNIQSHSPKEPLATGWSSIIGIVVAIVGNVLISFALNTQRYAHIKLSKERAKTGDKSQFDKDQQSQGYGTTQAAHGDSRSRSNTQDSSDKYRPANVARESQPLLQRAGRSVPGQESDEEEQGTKEKSYLSSPWWWLGISLMTVGECGNFLAYGFAPASIVSPLGVVALVSNCLIAPWMLREQFRKRDALGVLIAVTGCVIVVLSASGSNPKLDADEIWRLMTTWEFETYLGITIACIVVLMYASSRYGDRSILIDLGLVGLFGGYTALSTKGVASLLSNTIWRVVTFPLTYLLVAVLVFTAVMQIKYVNRALQRFDSTQVIPTQFVLFTLSVIMGSAILYRDFERKSAEDAGKFVAGCALTFLGVWCITSGRRQNSDDDSEISDDEDGIHLSTEDGVAAQPARGDLARTQTPSRPRARSSKSETPLLRVVTADNEEIPEDMLNSGTLNPGASSAVHHSPQPMSDESSTLSKPPMHATTSDPLLPTGLLDTPNVTGRAHSRSPDGSRSRSHGRPRTPDRQGSDNQRYNAPKLGSIGRHSFADMLPTMGPLTNPLSNSLSAIVADSIRKGVDTPPGSSLRRHSLRSKTSKRFEQGMSVTPLVPEEENMDDPPQSPDRNYLQRQETDETDGSVTGQSDLEGRSFGHAFGAYLKRKKAKSIEDGA